MRKCVHSEDSSKSEKKSVWGAVTSWVSSWFSSAKKVEPKKDGKCKGWPTRMMKRVFLYSLENLEGPGQTCDSNEVKYTCRGHRVCNDGKCQGSAYYNELKLKSFKMTDYEKL